MKLISQNRISLCLVEAWQGSSVARAATMLTMIVGSLLFGAAAQAQNQLVNPGFEAGTTAGWTTVGNTGVHNATGTYYNAGMCPADPVAENINVFDGTWVGNEYGNFSAPVNYSYFQQTIPTVGGSTWSADAWAYASHEDLSGINNFCVQVTFLDATGTNILAQYQSLNVTNLNCAGTNNIFPLDTWVELFVTNEVVPVVGTIPSGVMTAPAGTASVKYQLLFENVNYAGGSMYFDDADLDLISGPLPPVLASTNIVPNNMIMCSSNQLTYIVSSPSGTIANVQVVGSATGLPGTLISNSVSLTVGSPGLSVVGLNSNVAIVTITLQPNTAYNLTVSGTDNNGLSISAPVFLDTFKPVLLFEAEDFNFSSGLWITNIPDADGGLLAYSNQVGTEVPPIDEFVGTVPSAGPHYYRPGDTVSIQGAYEQTPGGAALYRQKFLDFFAANTNASSDVNTVDEEVGYVNNGDWQNYTRNFPAGNYNVYARIAVSGGAKSYFGIVQGDPTSSSQTVTNFGTFSLTDNNWNYYEYVPLEDQYGNLVSVPLGGTQTVRVTVGPGSGANQNFYFIVPAIAVPTPILQGSYPDGLHPFEPTNHFSFTVGQGAGSAIPAGNVGLTLNGANVTAQVSFTSTATNWTGTIPVSQQSIYTAVISVTNSTHLSSTYTVNFDTFTQNNYMVEASDWDFNGGLFIDNPMPTADSTIQNNFSLGTYATNSYWANPGGSTYGNASVSVAGVDWAGGYSGASEQYRADIPGTQVCADYLRQKFIDAATALGDPNIAAFNIGWYGAGNWLNYTRHYPAGNYNVYGRLAGGAGPFSGTILSQVTSGWGTTLQTSNVLGTFADPNASGWQTWHWVPLLDAHSNLVTVTFNGSTNTLTLTSGNNLNANFLMFVPAVSGVVPVTVTATLSGSQLGISFATQTGHNYQVQYAGSLSSPVTWTPLGAPIAGNGSTQTVNDTIGGSGSARYYRVSAQ